MPAMSSSSCRTGLPLVRLHPYDAPTPSRIVRVLRFCAGHANTKTPRRESRGLHAGEVREGPTEGNSMAACLAPRFLLQSRARVDCDLDATVFVATRFGVVRSEWL